MQKGSALIPFLLVSLLAIVGGIYFYFNQLGKTPTLTPTPGLSSKQPSQKNELKTYTNEYLGFEFNYDDKKLTVKEDSEQEFNKRGNGDFRTNFTSYVTYPPAEFMDGIVVLDETSSYDKNPLTIWVFNNSNNLTIEQFYANYWYYPFVWGDYTARRNSVAPVNDATISGQLALYGIVTYQPGSPKFVYLISGGEMYLFRIIGEEGEKILQSFKLLEEKVGCFVAGCSGQLCVEEAEKDIITTCEFREEYACYKEAKCERQPDGKCGWTKSVELISCLEEKRSSSPDIVF
ncbi:hypothetical protein HYT18_03670 [Candidatus Microgenomates bacterium]|nr:hypothetical protein [Candidatus Microgenomates bacterium]